MTGGLIDVVEHRAIRISGLQRLAGNIADFRKRLTQIVRDPGNQLARSRHLLAAKQLVAHPLLFLQAQRGGNHVSQMLHTRSSGGREAADRMMVVNGKNSNRFALREKGYEQSTADVADFKAVDQRALSGVR